jgi:hypothetical protein
LINKVYGDRPENNLIIARSGRHRLLKNDYFLICIISADKAIKEGIFLSRNRLLKFHRKSVSTLPHYGRSADHAQEDY